MNIGFLHQLIVYKGLWRISRVLFTKILILSVACIGLLPFASATAETKVAVVNISVLLENSPRSRLFSDQIKNKYLPIEQQLAQEKDALKAIEAALDNEAHTLSEEERLNRSRDFRNRSRKYNRDYEDFRDGLSNERQQALNTVRQEVMEAIDKVREQEKIDIVFNEYVSANKDVDLTPRVLAYLATLYQHQANTVTPPETTEGNHSEQTTPINPVQENSSDKPKNTSDASEKPTEESVQ